MKYDQQAAKNPPVQPEALLKPPVSPSCRFGDAVPVETRLSPTSIQKSCFAACARPASRPTSERDGVFHGLAEGKAMPVHHVQHMARWICVFALTERQRKPWSYGDEVRPPAQSSDTTSQCRWRHPSSSTTESAHTRNMAALRPANLSWMWPARSARIHAPPHDHPSPIR